MGVWNLNPTFRGTVLTWSSHKDNLACEDNIVKIISRHQRSWHVKDNMLFYYFSVIFAQFPPKESEETSRCCGSVSLLRLLADLRRRRSQTAWVRDEFCCPGKMTSSRHLHYKHFISCEKDKETHFSFSKKKKKRLPIFLSGLDTLFLFDGCRGLVAKRETSRLTLLCALDLLLEHSC